MAEITYRIVEHDGGWAYTAQGVYSETFRSHDAALAAAQRAAAHQRAPGEARTIEYETADGQWRREAVDGHSPTTEVVD